MNRGGSTGNPSAASSRLLPAYTDKETLQPADWISASEEEGEQRGESVWLSQSQNHQSPAEIHHSPVEKHHYSVKTHQNRVDNHQSPPTENYQIPLAENHQSPPAKKHQSPPAKKHQSPSEQHQSPPEENHQSPAQKHQNPTAEEHQSPPAEKHQKSCSPAETQLTAEEPDQRVLNKHTNHKDPPTVKQKTENYFQTEDQTALKHETNADQPKPKNLKPDRTELDTDQQQLGHSPVINKKETKDSPSSDQPDPHHTVLKKPGDPFCDRLEQERANSQEHRQQEDLCLTNQKTDPLHPHPPLKDVTVFPPPEKFTVPTAERHHDQGDPPHLNTTPPPLAVHLTTVSTLAPPLTIEVFCDQVQPRPPDSSASEPKLCGFLQKQGGPLKAWKLRWFTHEEKKNQLFYYRTSQDVTPLGRVELCSATFTYPLKAEKGTFHIKTPERTFVLKAVTQELMLYWLQKLQVKRWQHRQTTSCSETNNNSNNTADDFLPVLKSPLGLVGEAAANIPSQLTPLTNMSIKHPLIEIQNSVHSLRKRSSQEWSQSVFHVEAPPWTLPSAADTNSLVLTAPIEPLTPPPALSSADPAGQVTPAEGRQSPSQFDSRNRKTKSRSSSNMQVLHRDTVSSERTSHLQQEKHMLMEEVKAQKELVWILHKALEASQLEKRTCAEFLAATGEQERLELLRHRERLVAALRGRLEEAKAEADALRRSLTQRDTQLAELQENIRMLTEKNKARQEVIIKLSDQVTAFMSDPGPSVSSCAGSLDSQTFRQLQQDVENLKDDIEAYKTQNKFLNSEIYQLTKLWRKSSEQEKSLMVKCAFLEASNCQVESRYLGVLRQLQETKSLDPAQRGAVQKMIEDALKGELKSVIKLNVTRDHDEYGFKIIPDYEVEDMKLLAKIQALEIRSHNLLHQEGVDRPLLSRWAQYLAGRSDDDLCPSPELKALLRSGIPQEYRQQVWSWMVRARTRTMREQHPQHYQQLCEKSRMCPHPASRQIQLDLHRTLTTNQHFCSPSSPALQQLRRILLAFSWQNPAIGYCQGLNRLAAIALLVLQSEESAFWCLVSVVEVIMPQDYYTKSLVASQADQWVLKDFLAEKLPRLATHFEDHSIDVSLITFNWFLVVFVESLPSDILLPLWDAFLYEGTKVIFRYALALFKYKEDDILRIHDSVEIYQYLRFFTKTISDSRRLISIAFSDMNPFPGRLLRNRRALHLDRLQGELQELEEQQREFVKESSEHKDKELDTLVSGDEEEL